MLVLTRKIGEAIVIGENVRVSVLAKNHQRIRIGIEAPRDIIVRREELGNDQPGRDGNGRRRKAVRNQHR